jgi:hypothetical protein
MTQPTFESTVINRETVENPGGSFTDYTYFEPTEDKMKELSRDLFSKNWNKIVVGPCVEGAVFEIRFAEEPKLSYLDGYLTVDLGHWHFHLCIGPHKNCPSEELRKNRPVAKVGFFEMRSGKCGCIRSWGLRLWNGYGDQLTTVFLPSPFLSDEQQVLPVPQWERLDLYYSLREKYLGEPKLENFKPSGASDANPFLNGHG